MGDLRTIAQLLSRQYQADKSDNNNRLFQAIDAFQKSSANLSAPLQLQRFSHGFLQSLYTHVAYTATKDWVWPYWTELKKYCCGETVYSDGTLGCANTFCRDVAPIPATEDMMSWGKIDPRGLLIPAHEICSFDTWFTLNGAPWFPSRCRDNGRFSQQYDIAKPFLYHSWLIPDRADDTAGSTSVRVDMNLESVKISDYSFCRISYKIVNLTKNELQFDLCLAIRPFNHRTVVPLFDLVYNSKGFWMNEGNVLCIFPQKPAEARASNYQHGDCAFRLDTPQEYTSTRCHSGLANAVTAFRFNLAASGIDKLEILLPHVPTSPRRLPMFGESISVFHPQPKTDSLSSEKSETQEFALPKRHTFETLIVANINNLLIYTHPLNFLNELETGVGDFYAIIRALLDFGHIERAWELLELAVLRQWKNGYIPLAPNSMNSNGRFLLAACTFAQINGNREKVRPLFDKLKKAAVWIQKKRHDVSSTPHKLRGILPPSPRPFDSSITDYRFSDNFESLAGMMALAELAGELGHRNDQKILNRFIEDYLRNIQDMISFELEYRTDGILPAFPQRPLDVSAVDNLCALAPLQIEHKFPNPYWIINTLTYLYDNLSQPFKLGSVPPAYYAKLATALLKHNEVGKANEIVEIMAAQASQAGLWSTIIDTRTHRGIMGNGCDATASAWALCAIRQLNQYPPASSR